MKAFALPFVTVAMLASILIPADAVAQAKGGAKPVPDPAAPVHPAKPVQFTPPPADGIPDDEFGKVVRKGEQIFVNTQEHARKYVGNSLNCVNCHLDAGRKAGASPLWAAYVAYPAYRSKNKHVNTFAERLQGCFKFSMNGKAPAADDEVLVALETYAYWLATGAPVGQPVAGRGYPSLPKPAQAPDYARGQKLYAQHCAVCHGADGEGQASAGRTAFPPLWGPKSFNWGAGMHDVKNAAAFIKANMPLGLGGTLSDQEAWDVAMFMDSHERPQDPRFTGSVAETRKKYHDEPTSMYGMTVNGKVLGGK
jgi:thiosulfate dehydrogenase